MTTDTPKDFYRTLDGALIVGYAAPFSEVILAEPTDSGFQIRGVRLNGTADRLSCTISGCCHQEFALSDSGRHLTCAYGESNGYPSFINLLDLGTGSQTTATSSASEIYAPHMVGLSPQFVYGHPASSEGGGTGLILSRIGSQSHRELPRPSHGADVPMSVSPDGKWVMVRNHKQDADEYFLLDLGGQTRQPLRGEKSAHDSWIQFVDWE